MLGMAMPENVPGLVLVLALGAASLFSVGLLIAAVARDATAAYVLGALVLLPLAVLRRGLAAEGADAGYAEPHR